MNVFHSEFAAPACQLQKFKKFMQLSDWGFLLLPEFITKYTFGNQPPIYFPHFTKNLVDVQVAVYHAIVTPKLGNVGARFVSDHNALWSETNLASFL